MSGRDETTAYLSVSLVIIGISYHLSGSLIHTLLINAESWKMRSHLFSCAGLFANLICLVIDTIALDQALVEYDVPESWKGQVFLWFMIFNLCTAICTFFVMSVRMEQQYDVMFINKR
jgi:hypothetical protein